MSKHSYLQKIDFMVLTDLKFGSIPDCGKLLSYAACPPVDACLYACGPRARPNSWMDFLLILDSKEFI
jgi:hypothetical protein